MYFLIKKPEHKPKAIDYIQKLADNFSWLIDVERYKKNRSLAQNRLLWKWLTIISDNTGEDKEDLHTRLRIKLGLYTDELVTDKHNNKIFIRVLTETRRMDVQKFSEYLEHVQRLAIFLNIQLPIPDDYNFIMKGMK